MEKSGPIFWWLIGVTGGKFLSMITSATHPRWRLRPPSWIWSPLIFWPMPGSTGLICWWLEDGSFQWLLIQHGRYGSHLGFGFRRLSDERLSSGPIFGRLIGGHQSSPCSTSLKTLSSIHPQTMSQSGAYATPCVALVILRCYHATMYLQTFLDAYRL
jgi:hypothetical protein